jgi:hypothetical protein
MAEKATIQTSLAPEGVVYSVENQSISLQVTPTRKNSWQITLLRQSQVIDTDVLNPAHKQKREAFLAKLNLTDQEHDTAWLLLIHAGTHIVADTERLHAWQADQKLRAEAARQDARFHVDAANRVTLAQQARTDGRAVLEDPALLFKVGDIAAQMGLAGEAVTSRLLYLALTSRIGTQPINVAVKGASSAGKSYTVGKMLRLFPESAYFEVTSMSSKVLVYMEESFQHRVVVVYEHVGQEDADYFIRTLQSEGRLRHMVTEKNEAGQNVARILTKDGPTSFITTSTSPLLHDENETRLWSLAIDETEDQSKAVMQATAKGYSRPP